MNTDDIILIANKAIEELGLTDSQTYYIDGVITMALFLQATEYEAQLAKADTEANAMIVAARRELAEAKAINKSWAGMNRDMHAALAVARDKRDAAINELNALRTQGHSTQDVPIAALKRLMIAVGSSTVFVQSDDYSDCVVWLANLEGKVKRDASLGRIHYAATQPGHFEP